MNIGIVEWLHRHSADVIKALFDKKCMLIRLSPVGDCKHIPLLSYSLDDVTALRAKLWQCVHTQKIAYLAYCNLC